MSPRVLDEEGVLTIGQYQGESVFDVVEHDRRYLEWMLETLENLTESDISLIWEALLW